MNLSSCTFIARTKSYFIYFYEFFSLFFPSSSLPYSFAVAVFAWIARAFSRHFKVTPTHFMCHAVDFSEKGDVFASTLSFPAHIVFLSHFPAVIWLVLVCVCYFIRYKTYNIYLLVFFISFSITIRFLSICWWVQIVRCPLNCNVNNLTAFGALDATRKLQSYTLATVYNAQHKEIQIQTIRIETKRQWWLAVWNAIHSFDTNRCLYNFLH